MQFTNFISTALLAVLATAAPTVNLYSDANCLTRIQTIALRNNTCFANSAGFQSVKVTANPEVAVIDIYTGQTCAQTLTKAFISNNVTACNNGFQNGIGRSIILREGNRSS